VDAVRLELAARFTPKRGHRSDRDPGERETMTTIRLVTPFTAKSTAADVVAGIDLSSRRAIVTGGASGIGI
jgi:hypothetical protein